MGWEIKLFTEDGCSLAESLKRMPEHKPEACKLAWDWFDTQCQREMMDTIQNFARLDKTTEAIFNHVKGFIPAGVLMDVSDKGWEFLAMAIEHAVREHKASS